MQLLALILIFVLAAALQSYLYRRYGLSDLSYSCTFETAELTEGEETGLVETLSNGKWLPMPWVKSEITTSKWLSFANSQSLVTDKTRFVPSFFMLGGRQKITRRWKVKATKRGVYSIENIRIVSSDLLGSLTLSMATGAKTGITVLPSAPDLNEIAPMPKHLRGDFLVRRSLVEDPFFRSNIREYAYGDPLNKVHWPSTAKQKKLMVFQNDFTCDRSLSIILNMQSRENEKYQVIDEGVIENAIRVCAALIKDSAKTGFPVRFVSNTALGKQREYIDTGECRGLEYLRELTRLLAHLKLESSCDFSIFLRELSAKSPTTDIALVTGYLNDDIMLFANEQKSMGRRVSIYMMNYLDPQFDCGDIDVYPAGDYYLKQGGAVFEDKTA